MKLAMHVYNLLLNINICKFFTKPMNKTEMKNAASILKWKRTVAMSHACSVPTGVKWA